MDLSLKGPGFGLFSVSTENHRFWGPPDDSAGAADGAGAKKPRRRGSRGGRGRAKPKVAPAAGAVSKAPRTRAPATRAPAAGVRAPRRKPAPAGGAPIPPPIDEAPPAPTPRYEPREELFESDPRAMQPVAEIPAAPEPIQEAPAAQPSLDSQQNPPPAQNTNPAAAPAFVPGPPRIGMRPAVIRPAPPGRMSFSKGVSRHQFRPSGFRPPRAFSPPGTPAQGDTQQPFEQPQTELPQQDDSDSDPRAVAPRTPPQQQQPIPQGHNRPQHPHHRGPNQPRGNQRNDQRQPQQGRGRQGPGQQGQGRDQQGRGQQGQGRDQRPPQGGQRQPQPMAAQPRPFTQPTPMPVNEAFDQAPSTELSPDIIPLPPQPAAAQAEALAPSGDALSPAMLSDSAALAPFAEDIEIEEPAAPPAVRRQPTGRDMLINVVEGEEVRIAAIRRGVLEELYMERSSTESHIGNIYKGRVTNVEPSIQAAFIDFGIGKNGFLHISDLHPQYFPKKHQPRMPQPRRMPPPRPPQSPAAPAGFQPPVSAPDAANRSSPIEEHSNPAPMAHEAGSTDSPAVHFDEPPTDSGIDSVESSTNGESQNLPEGERMEEGANENGARAERSESGAEGIGEGADTDANASVSGQNPDANGGQSADAATEDSPESDTDRADFGSAYNSEFADEDEDFEDDYESAELDDGHMKPMEKVGRKTPRHDRPPIQQCLRRGQEVIVQVTKEGIGTKGPTLTSYISCPGRYLVMMPGMAQLGVSRKIEDLEQRRELKRTLQELNPPKNLGFIIRTAGTEVAKKELQGDLNYLVRMWKVIASRIRTHKAPVELYEESDLVIRTIRDVFSDQIDRIIVDNEQVASRVRDFLSIVDPRSAGMVEQYTGTMPLFQKFGVEREIEKINSRRVELKNGGSLVIDSTEALVAIDVNSGRYREMRDAELTAFNMNKEALKEVVRQLRLRDLGGVIVIDFIDMREERHKREIEHLLRVEMENDRAKTKVLRMSQFCMIEMTRQRVRPSLKRSIYMDCPHCHGSALIKTPESVSLDVMRRLAAGATRLDVSRIDVKAYPTVATFLLNRKRKALVELEEKTGKRINITPDEALAGDQILLQPFDGRGILMNLLL